MESSNNHLSDQQGIEELKKKLYERGGGDFQVRRSRLSPFYKNVNRTWEPEAIPPSFGSKPRANIWLRVLGFSFVFFLVALIAAWYIFSREVNVVSDKNIEIAVKGPVSVKAGDELDLQVALINKNTTGIEQVQLTAVFPSGSRDPDNSAKEISYLPYSVGRVNSGETVNILTKAIVYGKENDELEVKFLINYHLVGSNTLFEKETAYRLKINASPLDLKVNIPDEINSNQELTLDLNVSANSDKPLSNVLLEVIYPSGFQFKSANISPTYDSNKWLLGDLQPGVDRQISIKGIIEGQSEELKAFQVRTGIQDSDLEQTISVLYSDFFKTLTIKKPFLELALSDGTSKKAYFTLKNQKSGNYTISWTNNLSVKAQNVQIVAKLSGPALDKSSVKASGGYYSSIGNTITWDKHTSSLFESVEPGQGGQLDFSFSSIPLLSQGKELRNSEIKIDVTITGSRTSEGFSNEKIQTDLSRVVKLDSPVSLNLKTFYQEGVFTNTGPIPPRAEQTTTYTLNWQVSNLSNDVKNSVVQTTLPLGIEWVGLTSPSGENIAYDSQSRQITWNVGYLKAGTGFTLSLREVNFQVSATPSLIQIGPSLNLTSGVVFRGVDIFTGSDLVVEKGVMTSDLNDKNSPFGSGQVVK